MSPTSKTYNLNPVNCHVRGREGGIARGIRLVQKKRNLEPSCEGLTSGNGDYSVNRTVYSSCMADTVTVGENKAEWP